jgi:hypothetical protein
MKLKFVVPGEQIKMLEDVKFVDTGWSKMDIDTIPKDTVLQINQVYIRNNGYFQSSLTFKFISGLGFDKFLKFENDKKLKQLTDNYNNLQTQIDDLNKHDADWNYNPPWSERKRIPLSESKPIYKKGTLEEYQKFLFDKEGAFSYHKSTYMGMLEKAAIAIANFKPKTTISAHFCPVFRVPLAEIENWEIELLPGRVVEQKNLYVPDTTPPRPLEEIEKEMKEMVATLTNLEKK